MSVNRIIFRILILLAAMPAVFLSSCTEDAGQTGLENLVILPRDTVSYDSPGQFISIISSEDWYIDLTFSSEDEDWASVSPDEGSGRQENVMLTYSRNDSAASRKLYLNVSFSSGEKVTLPMVQEGNPNVSGGGNDGGGEDGGGDGDDPKPDPWPGLVSDPYQPGWIELPAVSEEEGKAFVFHRAQVDGRDKRNYSMYYDASQRIALWVAYPLCHEYMGSGRTDAWGFDPKIPDAYEPVLNHGWPEGGYDRGHQIPSGSRNANTEMNRQTFYYTNMTAQVSRFNQGLWANLENKVRGFCSACDTLYVVTGPIFYSEDPSDRTYTEDNNGNPVAVPDGYFKVLLSYVISSSSYYSVAFVYDNRNYDRSEPDESDLHTVADVEEMTGITFFNNLPSGIAGSVKSQLEPSRWGL